jgi:serine/threonine-protein kinase HipA
MSASELAVVLYGRHVAHIRQSTGGQFTLRYRDEPGNTPLSLSMPLVRTKV